MIKQFYLENFKSFAEPTIANLDDLLVVAGSNSGGKSTIIQALLLLAQTLENPRPDVVLDLGGRYVQFAEFREAVHGRPNSLSAGFTIGFDIDIEEINPMFEDIFMEKYSRRSGVNARREKYENVPTIISPICIRITFASGRSGNPIVQSALYEKTISGFGKISLTLVRDRGAKYRTKVVLSSTSKEKQAYSNNILLQIENIRKDSEVPSNKRIRPSALYRETVNLFQNFGFSLDEVPLIGSELKKAIKNLDEVKIDTSIFRGVLADILRFTFQEGIESSSLGKVPFNYFLLPNYSMAPIAGDQDLYFHIQFFDAMFGKAMVEVRRFLRNIKYIGPLRAKPERAYLAAGSPLDIGNAGENAVPILWLYQNDKVLSKTLIGDEPHQRKLVLAVQDWLHQFGIAYSFHITKPKRVIYQAELESAPGSETMVTIADVGFGVSQLLPVIVAGLRAPKGSTLILEQPEIHLHPRLQGKLADFFICMVELGKNVIVETHSEHLVNMLRLRIIQDKSGELQKKIGIIFVRSSQQFPDIQGAPTNKEKRGSYIENLRVDEYGKIINWPPDFFPETSSINEEILKAMMDKFSGGN